MKQDDRIRLRHMLDAGREALLFVEGRTRQDMQTDRMLVLSLVKEIEIIGEAASRLSRAVRAELTNIPWQDVIGMRNRLVHAYFDVDIDVVWSAVTRELPPLLDELDRILPA